MASFHLHSLFQGDFVSVADLCCRNPERGCRGEEPADAHELVFIRSSLFVKHSGRNRIFGDPTQALFFSPGECYRVSHPAGSGDDCTILAFSSQTVRDVLELHAPAPAGGAEFLFPSSHVAVDLSLIWRYEHLRRGLREGWTSALEAEENALALLESVLAAFLPGGHTMLPGRAAERRRREIVEVTRTALAGQPGAPHSLTRLAASVGCSPFHLTRVFRDQTGIPVHQYLIRLRLASAIERLASGEENLSALAFELGFSSHSHLTRVFRRSFGVAPSAFRRNRRDPSRSLP